MSLITDARAPDPCSPGNGACLQLCGVSVSYGSVQAISDVTLAVPHRQITAIIGPSGSGKTSLLQALNRLTDLVPNCRVSGQILFQEQDIAAPQMNVVHLRRRVGMIFQRPTPFPISIWRNVELPLREFGVLTRSEREARIENGLRDVGLWDEVRDRLHQSAMTLSGGQQQRLCLARTLVLDPEVLLLDEPCSSLDPQSTAVIEQHLRKCRERCAIVIATHNLAQARRLADHVAVFWRRENVGRLIESGCTDQIFNHPQQPETADFIFGRAG